ncbi:MAG: hypothetical protein ACFCBW_05610 [Candidatus Competibacterales bacterium]
MSEYQYYEFAALARPLSSDEMAQLRAISSRATITPTSFQNEYHWGDLKADPTQLLERYFDLHLYFASWGTRVLMLRLPKTPERIAALKPYLPGYPAELIVGDQHLIVRLSQDCEGGDVDEAFWETSSNLAPLVPVWQALRRGDLAPAYLAWLAAASAETRTAGEDPWEPPPPPGLKDPGLRESLAAFLDLDRDLVAAAVEGSAEVSADEAALMAWLQGLTPEDKDRWLLQAVQHPDRALGRELLAAFERHSGQHDPWTPRRTLGQLKARAKELWDIRQQEAVHQAAEQRRRERAARDEYLAELAHQADVWERLQGLIESRDYTRAANLAVDLQVLALRRGDGDAYQQHFAELRRAHSRRRSFLNQLKNAQAEAQRRGELSPG